MASRQHAINILADVIAKVREDGTYVHALLSFGERIKSIDWFLVLKELFSTLAQLIEEEDIIIFDILRIFYLSDARFWRKEVVLIKQTRRNLLETAIYSGNWSITNFLVKFATETDAVLTKEPEIWNPQLAHKATPSQWGKAIQLVVKSCVNSETIRRGISNIDFASQWTARLKNFKSVMESGYVTLVDLIGYPSAFMLMVRLGADLTIPNEAPNITLPYYIWSRGWKDKRLTLLKFLESVDPTLFDIPCGPNNVQLIYECFRVSDMAIVRGLQTRKIDMDMKDNKGRGIGHYIHPLKIFDDMFTVDERLKYATTAVLKGNISVLNTLLSCDHGHFNQFLRKYPELMKALDIVIQNDKQVLSKLLATIDDPFLHAYCIVRGHKSPTFNRSWSDMVETWIRKKEPAAPLVVADLVLQFNKGEKCRIHDLPDDVISLIIAELPISNTLQFFSASKSMQEVFKRLTSPLLWKKIATNNMNSFKMKYLESQPITDWRSHVIKEMRWRKNWIDQRFTERTIFTEMKDHLCFASDDNWFVVTKKNQVHCWNCHTFKRVSMEVPDLSLGNIMIINSTPDSLVIAIAADTPLAEPIIVIADPVNRRVIKQIRSTVSAFGPPFFFKFQSKLYIVAKDLLEVDIEAGKTKSFWDQNGGASRARFVAVNPEDDSLLLFTENWNQPFVLLDADANVSSLQRKPRVMTTLLSALISSGSVFSTADHVLEFGQWFGQRDSGTTFNSVLDAQNNRLLLMQRSGGIALLLHPNLETWSNAWAETPQKFVAMNSRYLFLFNPDTGCLYCRDYDWTN